MRALKDLLKSPMFVLGASVLVGMVIFAVFGPLIFGIDSRDAFATDWDPYMPPDELHVLGTNAMGQDAFALLVLGLRTSLFVGAAAGAMATFLGALIGILGGYKGGLADNLLSGVTNLLVIVPQLVILILLSNSTENRSFLLLAGFIGATAWVWVARALRAQAASLRDRDHVSLAKLNGFGTWSILARQILPYVMSYVFMAFIMQLGAGVFAEAALSMLGLGPRGADVVSLGYILNQAKETGAYTDGMWWVFLPPTLLVTAIVFALYLVNTAMERVFNPRIRR